jgi:formylglycine-generating enzyme required for sulfatase activity
MMRWLLVVLIASSSHWATAASPHGLAMSKNVPKGKYQPFFRESGESDKEVGPLSVDVTPVTNVQYREFTEAHPEWRRSRVKSIFADGNYLRHWRNDGEFDGAIAHQPVVNVSWFAARKYCESKSQRLMTVAEWEYYSEAQDQKNLDRVLAWYGKPSGGLRDVGTEAANGFGLKDMHGLIWEWVEDYASVIISQDSRSSNEAKGAMFCGSGSLNAKDPTAYATFMRFAYRSSLKGAFSASLLGFRCARNEPLKKDK